jgi:CBS domain-containing protein
MTYVSSRERLAEVKKQLETGGSVDPITVRQFIRWFGAERRGNQVAWRIRRALERNNLTTTPDFDGAHIDAEISFVEKSTGTQVTLALETAATEPQSDSAVAELMAKMIEGASADPAFRVGRLESANTKPLCVKPDCTLSEAATLMLRHDFSQLPVMSNDREVKGIISWETIGSRLAFGLRQVETVRECMKPHYEVKTTDSLFGVIARIVEHSYVLVRGENRTISGIVTTSDLSLQFQQVSEPFLLLSEIENHIRLLIDGKFTADELSSVRDPGDQARLIESVADLTLGEHIRLLENPVNWQKVGLKVDRKTFIRELDKVRGVRNDVMHFDPDGISSDDHDSLRNFLHFMHELRIFAY